MELTPRRVRRIWRRAAKPYYPLDETIIAAAAKADAKGGSAYAQIQNPTAHHIYRYLTEFIMQVLGAQHGHSGDGLRILDWGGGKGYVTYFLKQKGANAALYETDVFKHRALWRQLRLDVKTSADGSLPFADGTFDAVVGFGVLEHVPYDYEALKEVNRVLKPNGLLFVFNLPNAMGYMHRVAWWRGIRYHDRLYQRREAQAILKRAGFNTIGRPWFRQLLPKNLIHYKYPRLFEWLDLFATNYTPLCFLASSIEFVARKQHTYTSAH